jgi:UDP-glucose:(heptosyl)LPS alpha-1,3-glucosyltransferase
VPIAKEPITIVAREVRQDGGQERALFEAISGLLAEGHCVQLIAQVCTLPPHPKLTWTAVRTPRRPFPIGFPMFALAASALLARRRKSRGRVVTLGASVMNRVDVVTVQFCQAAFADRRITRSSKESWAYRFNTLISRRLALGLERWCYRPGRVKHMTAVSDLVAEELRRWYQLDTVPIDVIPNGVDVERFRPDSERRCRAREDLEITPDQLVALFVGGDWQRKGLDIAIDAAAQAGWRLLVLGRGDQATWSQRAAQAGADVMFLPHTQQPELIFSCADAFLFPSRYEGFALVTIEAAASGLPLLVTEATGAGPLARHTGIDPLPHDPAAFAVVLRRLAENPDERAQLSQRSREEAEKLAWPHIVARYLHAYPGG